MRTGSRYKIPSTEGFSVSTPTENSPNHFVPMSNLETDGSPQLELARSYFQGAQKRNIDQIAKTMHKGFIRVTHPRSAGRPAQSREEYLQTLGDLIGLWTEDAQVSYVI